MNSAAPGRGEQHFAVRAAALLGGLDPERIEPPGQGGDALVGRENALAVSDQRRRDALQILAHLRSLLMLLRSCVILLAASYCPSAYRTSFVFIPRRGSPPLPFPSPLLPPLLPLFPAVRLPPLPPRRSSRPSARRRRPGHRRASPPGAAALAGASRPRSASRRPRQPCPARSAGRLASRRPAVRRSARQPGELIPSLARPLRQSPRITGERAAQSRGAGWGSSTSASRRLAHRFRPGPPDERESAVAFLQPLCPTCGLGVSVLRVCRRSAPLRRSDCRRLGSPSPALAQAALLPPSPLPPPPLRRYPAPSPIASPRQPVGLPPSPRIRPILYESLAIDRAAATGRSSR